MGQVHLAFLRFFSVHKQDLLHGQGKKGGCAKNGSESKNLYSKKGIFEIVLLFGKKLGCNFKKKSYHVGSSQIKRG